MSGYLPGDYYGHYLPQAQAPIGFEMHNQPQSGAAYPPRNDIYPAAQSYEQPAQQSYAAPYEATPLQPASQDYSHHYPRERDVPPVGFEAVRNTDSGGRSRASERPFTNETQETTDGASRSSYRVPEVNLNFIIGHCTLLL